MRLLLSIALTLCSFLSFSQDEVIIRVGLFDNEIVRSAKISINAGQYEVRDGSTPLAQVSRNNIFSVTPVGQELVLSRDGIKLGTYKRLIVASKQWESSLRLKVRFNTGREKTNIYPDNLVITAKSGALIIVNESDIERYVAGVTEAEAGKGHEVEYYKVQSVISRTYALANMGRHSTESFNVCDKVHCQAYHGMSRWDENILIGTYETKDHVLVSSDIEMVTAAFHSNCGGHTLNSEHVWRKPLPYLVGRRDTFCMVMPHSHWEKTVSKTAWLNYMKRDFPLDSFEDSLSVLAFFPENKTKFFSDSLRNLKMTKMRADWKLRSAFFTIHEYQDSVQIIGRGFGHGVGLCQEGAMRMATLGYEAKDILHFYYRDVHLIDRRQIDFFREDFD
ncbi:MAG: SpoIID/LytB domain-containing protein [Flavobacteriales bacterium]|nr:SpoIID/LytB domain-containing protein [Flavobacteriales bacterium]